MDFLANLEMSEDELAKAIIGTIGDVDAYQLPGELLICSTWFVLLPAGLFWRPY